MADEVELLFDGILHAMRPRGLYERNPTYFPDGKVMPTDVLEHTLAWARVKEDDANCFVGRTPIGRYEVSTVWIGELSGTFETALFMDGEFWGVLRRFDTWLDALRAHLVYVSALQLSFALDG
jgi:hypothetical protein